MPLAQAVAGVFGPGDCGRPPRSQLQLVAWGRAESNNFINPSHRLGACRECETTSNLLPASCRQAHPRYSQCGD
jgi:hypothetical protein